MNESVPGAETQSARAKRHRASFVEVDLGAVGRNTRKWKALPAAREDCRLMAVIKADAYGHGLVPVAERVLARGADWLGVALAGEALVLREAGICAPILILGHAEAEAYAALISAGVRITVFSLSQGEACARAARAAGKKALIHLKIDTGMGRIGFLPGKEAEEEIYALAAMEELELEGCFTHFARADEDGAIEDGEESWRLQYRKFGEFLSKLRGRGIDFPILHCANTAASMRGPEAGMHMRRIGIGIYGLYPSAEAEAWGILDLEPALCWKSRLAHVKWLPGGSGLSYGHTWVAEKDTLIGTVPLGYADGFSRALSGRGRVLVRGKSVPVVGRVCMDQFMVDLSDAPEALPGDEVVLIGRQGGKEITAADMAALTGTISYEIVCGIGSRIPRLYRE